MFCYASHIIKAGNRLVAAPGFFASWGCGKVVPVDAMLSVIADVARRADEGDEDAAIQLNRLAEGCSPAWLQEAARQLRPEPVPHPLAQARPTLGEILAQAMGMARQTVLGDEYDVIDAAAHAIADHYSLPHIECLSALFDLENEALEAGELLAMLECPLGIATLGRRVAQMLIGSEAEEALPPLAMSWQ